MFDVGLSSLLPHVFQNLHPVVVSIGHINLIVRPNRHTAGQTEFARTLPALPDVQQQLPGQIKNLEIIKHRVRDIDMAERVRGDTFRPAKMPRSIAVAAKGRDEFAAEIKNLHPAVHRIRHEQMSLAIAGNMRGKIEFARGRSTVAELKTQRALQIKNKHRVRLRIHHRQRVIGDGQSDRPDQWLGNLPHRFSIIAERKDPGQLRIGDVKNSFVTRHGDRRGEARFAGAIERPPLFAREITEIHPADAGIGDAEISGFIEGEAERLLQSNALAVLTRDPVSEPREHGRALPNVPRRVQAANILDPRRIRRGRPYRIVPFNEFVLRRSARNRQENQ